MRVELCLIACILLVGAFARADAIYLQGGRVLEGTATIEGDKVTVQLESGRMSFSRAEVERIEKRTAPLDEVARREKDLAKDDVAGMLELASYCNEHNLLNKERRLLERVLALQPDHAEARHRLGYVREDNKWVLRSEQLRKERLAEQARRGSDLERKRQQLQVEEAQLQRDRAEAQLRAERERSQQVTQQQPSPSYYAPMVFGGSYGYRTPLHQQHGSSFAPVNPSPGFVNGVPNPQAAFNEAYRTAYGHYPAR